MAKSLEDLEECMEELEIRMSSRFDALKQFTMNTLKEMQVKQELETVNESLGSLKEEFESFKTVALQEGQSSSAPKEDCRKRLSDELPSDTKRPFLGFNFQPLKGNTSTPLRQYIVARTLEEVRDHKLKESLRKYYTEDHAQSEKLNPLQCAYFQWFFNEKNPGYTGKRTVIEKLIKAGVRDGVWAEDFVPVGVKKGFFDYLKEKARNNQKKKLSEDAMGEFVEEYANL